MSNQSSLIIGILMTAILSASYYINQKKSNNKDAQNEPKEHVKSPDDKIEDISNQQLQSPTKRLRKKSSFKKKKVGFHPYQHPSSVLPQPHLEIEKSSISFFNFFKTFSAPQFMNEATAKKRLYIVNEILQTERTYVQSLLILNQYFFEPLKTNMLLQKRIFNCIFSNLWDIINVNQLLFKELLIRFFNQDWDPKTQISQKTWHPQIGKVADIFLSLSPFFKMYSIYAKNFQMALEVLNQEMKINEKFKLFVQEQYKNPELKGLTLQAYLIMPIQRIPRYRLLLEDLLKHTPQSHPDFQNLQKALQLLFSIADFVNEQIRLHENFLKLLDLQNRMIGSPQSLIQPNRQLVKMGKLIKISRKEHQERIFFLMSDSLLYCFYQPMNGIFSWLQGANNWLKNDKNGDLNLQNLQGALFFCREIPLSSIFGLLNVPEPFMQQPSGFPSVLEYSISYLPLPYSFIILSSEKSFQVYCASLAEKSFWMTAIEETRLKYFTKKEQSRLSISLQPEPNPEEKPGDELEEDYCAPVWIPDEAIPYCMICKTKFTFFTRKHHCRKCGSVICAACSNQTFILKGNKQRICDPCHFEHYHKQQQEQQLSLSVSTIPKDVMKNSYTESFSSSLPPGSPPPNILRHRTSSFKTLKTEPTHIENSKSLLSQILKEDSKKRSELSKLTSLEISKQVRWQTPPLSPPLSPIPQSATERRTMSFNNEFILRRKSIDVLRSRSSSSLRV